jgi:hypothetical protein
LQQKRLMWKKIGHRAQYEQQSFDALRVIAEVVLTDAPVGHRDYLTIPVPPQVHVGERLMSDGTIRPPQISQYS